MDLLALGTLHFFSPDGGAEHHADGYAYRQPRGHVSGYHSEHRAQRRSQGQA